MFKITDVCHYQCYWNYQVQNVLYFFFLFVVLFGLLIRASAGSTVAFFLLWSKWISSTYGRFLINKFNHSSFPPFFSRSRSLLIILSIVSRSSEEVFQKRLHLMSNKYGAFLLRRNEQITPIVERTASSNFSPAMNISRLCSLVALINHITTDFMT